ncbi:hypothetical protein [Bacteroides helcogenes]|nr:hypothetical protein [Bacteroides helcogenes]MDY5239551.1 hypothetical protein [Bacteroides helcogenes]
MMRKINCSSLELRFYLFLLLFLNVQVLFAQEDSTRFVYDTLLIKPVVGEPRIYQRDASFGMLFPFSAGNTFSSAFQSMEGSVFRIEQNSLCMPYQIDLSPHFRGDYGTDGTIMQFRRGALLGSGGQSSITGIGHFNEALLFYQQAIGQNLKFQIGMDAMKINMSHITGQAFTASGALAYRVSAGMAFRFFGSYAIGNTYGINTHSYGATMLFDVSKHFNMEVGVQRYYNSMRGRWETVPVVIPAYDFDKFKLVMDVGGILFEILRNVVFKDKGGGTIAPTRSPTLMK